MCMSEIPQMRPRLISLSPKSEEKKGAIQNMTLMAISAFQLLENCLKPGLTEKMRKAADVANISVLFYPMCQNTCLSLSCKTCFCCNDIYLPKESQSVLESSCLMFRNEQCMWAEVPLLSKLLPTPEFK